MWIVRVALTRPYTFVVLALLILGIGPLTIARMPVDIFPNINIPVIAVAWQYSGMSAEDLGDRIVSNFERSVPVVTNDVEHTESQSVRGKSIVKVYLQPGAQLDLAVAQIAAVSQTVLRTSPPGTGAPIIITFSASSVPIVQLALSGKGLSEQQLNDIGTNFLRPALATVPGAQVPNPYGGKIAQVQVDIDPAALQAKGLAPADVVNAMTAQNLILPAGTAKIGGTEYDIDLNASPDTIDQIDNLPIKTVNGTTILIKDVAHVRNGYPPQTNIVRVDGRRASLTVIQKNGNASTLDVIAGAKAAVARLQQTLPPELEIKPLLDQSVFVRASIQGVVREAILAAFLTGFMILAFLGSWRSTLIIAVSIPLSILCSIITLSALGETINIMTLGGLALAVGILVDDATVEIENVNRHLEEGKPAEQAILEGAQEIAVPALVSTLCICIVFVPMFFLTGVARFLFVPMAEAVVFAMLASYMLSRTLVPTMAKFLLRAHTAPADSPATTLAARIERSIDRGFLSLRGVYRNALAYCLAMPSLFAGLFLLLCLVSLGLARWVGEDFFPAVDSGQFKLHLRGPSGMRIEETAALCDNVERAIHEVIPRDDFASVIDNIGLPYSAINLSYTTSAPIGASDADILVGLKPGHRPTAQYLHDLRLLLPQRFPGVVFSFLPADIVTQIVNFGLPAPIDIQLVGRNLDANRLFAARLADRLRLIPGMVDLHVHQTFDQPLLHFDVDRTRASQVGLTQRDVANNLLIALSGSGQTAPTFWLNHANGVTYNVTAQMPEYRLDSLQQLGNIPVVGTPDSAPQVLEALTDVTRRAHPAVISHYDVASVIDIFGAVQGRDLGAVAREMTPIVDASRKDLPRGSRLAVRGVVETMRSSFNGLLAGLALAIVLVYLLIVVNFQSWLDPFIIISGLPAALAGIVWMLFLSHTTINVPSLTGAIMCMGVATANSILVVSFAREQLRMGRPALDAALEAGYTRFRPVLMTALAMIMGMLPMAVGLGEGGEQNAPLGRAVLGGLTFATVATLFFVPAVFVLLHRARTSGASPRPPGSLQDSPS